MPTSQFSIDSKHPQYQECEANWELTHDAFRGEKEVKKATTKYLPSSSGMRALGMGTRQPGQLLYHAYLMRAVYPEILEATASSLVGLMVREPWQVTVPGRLNEMLERATARGEPIAELIDRVLQTILSDGRRGLLVDVDPEDNLPYIVDYPALNVTNWDDNPVGTGTRRRLRMVVVDESRFERAPNAFTWVDRKRYRALLLDESGQFVAHVEAASDTDGGGVSVENFAPSIRGRRPDFIPFVFINSNDLTPTPGPVPLLGLARMSMTIYRLEADYRQSLFMQGQDTLVLNGVTAPSVKDTETVNDDGVKTGADAITGTGAAIYLPGPPTEMSAKFIGVQSTGLREQRQALENDYLRAEQFGLALLTSGQQAEAAETVLTRVRARTANLAQIGKNGAAGVAAALKMAAQWMGEDPNAVEVVPNLDFLDNPMAPGEFLTMVQSKLQGQPISWQTLHERAQRGDLVSTDWESELERLREETRDAQLRQLRENTSPNPNPEPSPEPGNE